MSIGYIYIYARWATMRTDHIIITYVLMLTENACVSIPLVLSEEAFAVSCKHPLTYHAATPANFTMVFLAIVSAVYFKLPQSTS